MLRRRINLFSGLIAGGLLSWNALPAYSQAPDVEGIIRISDSVIPPSPTADQAATPGTYSDGTAHYGNCPGCPECRGGAGGRHGTGYRFSPPVKRPIYRPGVAYYKMWPDAWTGSTTAPVSNYQYPTVYMPTDTTQLGYYYQHVPYWQPREGMVPPPPMPRQWHTTVDQSLYSGHIPSGKIMGFAPTATQIVPTPAPINSQVAPQQGTNLTPVIPENKTFIEPSAGLEKSDISPALLPID